MRPQPPPPPTQQPAPPVVPAPVPPQQPPVATVPPKPVIMVQQHPIVQHHAPVPQQQSAVHAPQAVPRAPPQQANREFVPPAPFQSPISVHQPQQGVSSLFDMPPTKKPATEQIIIRSPEKKTSGNIFVTPQPQGQQFHQRQEATPDRPANQTREVDMDMSPVVSQRTAEELLDGLSEALMSENPAPSQRRYEQMGDFVQVPRRDSSATSAPVITSLRDDPNETAVFPAVGNSQCVWYFVPKQKKLRRFSVTGGGFELPFDAMNASFSGFNALHPDDGICCGLASNGRSVYIVKLSHNTKYPVLTMDIPYSCGVVRHVSKHPKNENEVVITHERGFSVLDTKAMHIVDEYKDPNIVQTFLTVDDEDRTGAIFVSRCDAVYKLRYKSDGAAPVDISGNMNFIPLMNQWLDQSGEKLLFVMKNKAFIWVPKGNEFGVDRTFKLLKNETFKHACFVTSEKVAIATDRKVFVSAGETFKDVGVQFDRNIAAIVGYENKIIVIHAYGEPRIIHVDSTKMQ